MCNVYMRAVEAFTRNSNIKVTFLINNFENDAAFKFIGNCDSMLGLKFNGLI